MAHILVVDDEPGFQTFLRDFLETSGHRVFTAGSAVRALELLRRVSVDLILADYRMPELTGIDLVRLARKEGSRSPAIVMTAYADIPVVVAAMRYGVRDFLVKPFRLDALAELVRQCLGEERALAPRSAVSGNGADHA